MFACDGKRARKTKYRSGTKKLTARDMRRLNVSLSRDPHSTSVSLLEETQVLNVSRDTRCKILNEIGKVRHPLTLSVSN